MFVIQNAVMYSTTGAILIVACFGIFNIISTVIFEKTRDIAILKSIGFEAGDIRRIFLFEGLAVGLIGSAFGCALGFGLTHLLASVQFDIKAMVETKGFVLKWSIWHYAIASAMAVGSAVLAAYIPARRAAAAGRLGLGVACHVKATGGSPDENVEIRFRDDGGVDLVTGTQTIGQSHETTFPQLLAEKLGVPNGLIRLVQGDTDAIPFGGGHGSSRATYMGGTAIFRAADEIVAKGKAVAAAMLDAAETDVTFEDGRFRAAGSNRSVDILAVAAEAHRRGAPLDTYHAWTRDAMTYPNGVHIAEVAVDPETGVVTLLAYTAVDDYGVVVNPPIAFGQVHGAIAQGVGQALLEEAVFDPETGQPLTGSFMDYALPRADDLPSFAASFRPTRCTTNPLGVKGAGEAGAIAGYPAVTLAILDALDAGGVQPWTGAATPERIWQAIRRPAR